MQALRQLRILVLRIENEYFAVFRSKVCQQALCGIGLTGTGLTYNHHVGVYPLAIPAEEINKYRYAFAAAQLNAAHIGYMGKHPGIAGRQRIAGYSAALAKHRIIAADLRANECLGLVKVHAIEPEPIFLIAAANRFFHIRDNRTV